MSRTLLERNARVGQLQLYDDLRAILCARSSALGLGAPRAFRRPRPSCGLVRGAPNISEPNPGPDEAGTAVVDGQQLICLKSRNYGANWEPLDQNCACG